MKRSVCWLALVAAGATLGACGSSDTATTTVVTVIQQAPAQAPSSAGSTDTPSTSSDASGGSGSAGNVSDDGTGGDSSGGKITVPNEVGKQHQAAQDDLQAHGLFNLAEEDATGQGRMLLIDRNWQVISQSPAAGAKLADDAMITLKSKKYTDP